MAFVKEARASIIQPKVSGRAWAQVRTAAKASAEVSENLVARASEILGKPFSPKDYLLTHATIVASVDTYEPPNAKLGSVMEGGFRVNRMFANYRVKRGSDKYINNNCFIPGTSITMADGTVKPIEEVQVGDLVLTHKARARRVTETFRHDVDGELLEIKVRGSNERLFVTSEHPFFAFLSNTECVACGGPISREHRTVSHLLGKHYCSKECYYQYKVPNATLRQNKHGQFVGASCLTSNDFAATPVVPGEQDVGLTLGQARLVGLFAAEGYYELDSRNGNERVGVCWAFHEDERHTLAKAVCDLMRTEFGIECVVRPHSDDRGIHVTTKTCRKAVDFFSGHVFGEGATDKRLHRDLLTAPIAIQVEILRGWFEGDGSAFDTGVGGDVPGDFRLTGTSGSQSLANQMRALLHRQGVAPRMHHTVSEGRRRLVVDGAVRVVSDPSKECHSWVVSCGAGYISDLVQDTVYADAYEAAAEARGGFQQSPDLRFLNGYCLQMFTGISPVEYRGPVYNFETEEDHSYIAGGVAVHNCDAWDRDVLLKSFRTFIGGHNFVEHVQIEEMSRGRIIDAVARDVGDSVYIDILIATDRKHIDLVEAIVSGKMSTLSMGCTVDGTQCTKCGHWAADETEMCNCVKYEKGNTFFDEQGQQHRVAELCGHKSLDPTGGVVFVEGSWVGTPAFTGAVLRNVIALHPNDELGKVASAILATPPEQWSRGTRRKVAALVANFMAGWDDEEGGGDEAEAAPAEAAPSKGPFDDIEDELTTHMKDRVRKKLKKDMDEKDQEDALGPEDSSLAPNDNLVHQSSLMMDDLVPDQSRKAAYGGALSYICRTASSDADLMNRVAELSASYDVQIPIPLYRAAMRLGSVSEYEDVNQFVRACRAALGRKPTTAEAKVLFRLGKLIPVRGQARSGVASSSLAVARTKENMR